jgi:hypothetical protein
VFRDAIEQGFKVKRQTDREFHFYTKNSLLIIIHVYRIPFSEIILGDSRPKTLLLPECHVRYDLVHPGDYQVSSTSFLRQIYGSYASQTAEP